MTTVVFNMYKSLDYSFGDMREALLEPSAPVKKVRFTAGDENRDANGCRCSDVLLYSNIKKDLFNTKRKLFEAQEFADSNVTVRNPLFTLYPAYETETTSVAAAEIQVAEISEKPVIKKQQKKRKYQFKDFRERPVSHYYGGIINYYGAK
jgi:hypothetical protein